MARTPYPLERMDWPEYIKKYSKGDTPDAGLTDDEFYELEREIFEKCLEQLGIDFEGMRLFDVVITRLATHDRFRFVPVPSTNLDPKDLENATAALDAAHFNLKIAQSEYDRAFNWYMKVTTGKYFR